MKKAVITILGIQNPGYDDKGLPFVKNYHHQAAYYFENNTNKQYYYNTLPLLIDEYSDQYNIIPISTNDSKIFNQDVLKQGSYTYEIDYGLGFIEDDKNYMQIFSLVNNLIDKYDRVIVDLTHGFRHLPLLTIIDLIIHNFKQNQKIEKILFAKEMVKHTPKDKGEYEIIDLKEYLDIANLSFVLSTFEQNYTVSNHIKTVDKDYQVLIDILSKFSEHIMANSLVNLLQKNNSLIEQITGALDTAINHPKSQPLTIYLKSIKKHFEDDFIVLKDKEKYIQLFELAKIMKKKGYYLNAITLLNEAVGWYCIISLINFNGSLKNEYKKALNNSWDTYQVVSEAKNIIKYTFNEREYTNKLKIKNINELQNQIENNKNTKKFSRDLIQEIDKHRNNLAHANSGNEIENVEKLLEKLFGRFQTYCIDDNILKKTPASIEDLKNKFS